MDADVWKKRFKNSGFIYLFILCFQLGADNIVSADPSQIECEWRLTSVSQYMQMAARQGSLVVIIHVQDLWLRQQCAV